LEKLWRFAAADYEKHQLNGGCQSQLVATLKIRPFLQSQFATNFNKDFFIPPRNRGAGNPARNYSPLFRRQD
jgi:hypothetical protein